MKRTFAITALIVLSVAAAGSVSAQKPRYGYQPTGKVVKVEASGGEYKNVTLEGGRTLLVHDPANNVQVGKTCVFLNSNVAAKILKCEIIT